MKQYIDKAEVIAKIKKRFDEYSSSILKHYDACKEAKAQELGKILTILDTLETKDMDLEKIKRDWRNKGYIEGRKQALIPAEQLGLPRSLDLINMSEIKIEAKKWADNNASNCDYIGAVAAENAFIACAQWLINKAKENKL